jgi:glycosyltransferase involved in cell wall biosynthesis/GT2 family glycosyltransferase
MNVPARAAGIDIIIPVFGAADDLGRCLASVLRHTSMPPHRLILVLDGPQGRSVNGVIETLTCERPGQVVLETLSSRGGFAAATNHGVSLSDRDFVVLNSDTIVTEGWAEGLVRAAASTPDVGTVTPLSNNATLCSVPEGFEENLLPSGFDADEVAGALMNSGPPRFPELPTGVGFCLYVRRRVIDAVGAFNSRRFGLGYGEENDLCMRARAAGFRNIAGDNVFVYHAGRRSFGSEAAKRERAAQRRLGSGYRGRVAAFMASDPLQPRRRQLVEELHRRWSIPAPDASASSLRIMHVVHGWPPFDHGGSEWYARSLATEQTGRHRVSAFVRFADLTRASGDRVAYLDEGVRVRLVCNNFGQRNPLARNSLVNRQMGQQLARFIRDERPDLVHIHHLAGHGANLAHVAADTGVPVVYQVQDWWAGCARSNLGLRDGSLCPGPRPDRCASCLPMTGIRPRRPLNIALHLLRRTVLRRALRRPAAYIMGSDAILGWYRDHGLLVDSAPAHVLEYGVDVQRLLVRGMPAEAFTGSRPLCLGVIGAVMPHKGAHVAVDAIAGLPEGRVRLEIWGRTDAAPEYVTAVRDRARELCTTWHGAFEESKKQEVLAGLDLLLVPSTAMESFGLVAREAMACGVPVLASELGALAGLRLGELGCGAFFPPEDSKTLRALIEAILADPGLLARWRSNLPMPTSVAEHARAVDRVYRQIVQGAK